MIEPLKDILVVDFSQVMAAPLCAQTLGELGATVIKVEPPGKGDDSRAWPPFRGNIGAIYAAVNRHKRGIAADLKSAEGREVALQLARRADVVIENYSEGVAERLGIDYASLRAENPRLIYCSVSGYGRSGPLASQKGYDIILQAFSGMLGITGDRDGPPTRIPFSPIDQFTGQNAVSGVLAALIERGKTGQGAFVEVSLFDSAMAMLRGVYQNHFETGQQPARERVRQPTIAPYQSFEAADGTILIGIANEKLWRAFCEKVGREDLLQDPRFLTNADRVAHYDEIEQVMQAIVIHRTIAQWEELLTEIGVPHSPVHTFAQVVAHPHTQARGSIVEARHPWLGAFKGIAMPVRFNGARADAGLAPPVLGQHTREVMRWLGYPDAHIDELLRRKVIESEESPTRQVEPT